MFFLKIFIFVFHLGRFHTVHGRTFVYEVLFRHLVDMGESYKIISPNLEKILHAICKYKGVLLPSKTTVDSQQGEFVLMYSSTDSGNVQNNSIVIMKGMYRRMFFSFLIFDWFVF